MSELSELDAAVLRELQENARSTNRAIAEAIHVAPSTSLERIRTLRERGVIRGYHAEVDLAALGRDVQALIAIRIRPPSRKKIEAFRDWAHQLSETVGVFVVSGGSDFLLHVAVANTDALYSFVIDRLTERPEVADVNTSVVYEHLRTFTIEPFAASASAAKPTRRASRK
jgi:DNA-binding Lrp family transcriptional regulator